MDFTFGTLATDELKLVHHRSVRQGVQHGYHHHPLDPAPGEPVTIFARTGVHVAAQQTAIYYTTDGSIPAGSRGVAQNGFAIPLQKTNVVWDTLTWGYVTQWQVQIPAHPENTIVRYLISAWEDNGSELFADFPNVQDRAEKASAAFFRGEPLPEPQVESTESTIFTYHVDRLTPPAWAREAIIYQIFVDRFCPGKGREWLQTDDLMGFCGGTLWGVLEKLDYIEALGVNCIWLSPTFVSPTHHGYDAVDYYKTEPRLGGDDALRAVIESAHRRGIRVLLDLACSHISIEHPIFKEALSNPNSRYRQWFYFDDSEIGYRTFFGVASMPQINAANSEARDWLCDIGCYWLREFKIDGYRLDYAIGPGAGFWADFRAACRVENPDCFLFGEVIDAPDGQRIYAGRLDGCLDFHGSDALRRTYGWRMWDEKTLELFLEQHLAYFPEDFLLPTFLDNHDMNRFLYIAYGDKTALRQAAAAQMKMPEPPIIYYGTEIGLSQKHGIEKGLHMSRMPMIWGTAQDTELLEYYKEIIRQRKKR